MKEQQLASAQSPTFRLGAVQINLQSGEVLVNNRTSQPTPDGIKGQLDFQHIFRADQGTIGEMKGGLCTVTSRNEWRQRVRIDKDGITYDVEAWTALQAGLALSSAFPRY